MRKVWDDVNAMGAARPITQSNDFIDSHRMIFYYLGVASNIVSFAILVEQTGGMLASPYTAPMVALILTGQQLSRFKTQSTCLISAGCIVAATMWLYESTIGLAPSPPAPRALGFTLLAISLVAAGAITNAEKDHNYLIEGMQRLPTHANIYRAADGTWHYVLYSSRYRLDPVVGNPSSETGTAGQADTLRFLRTKIEAEVSSMYQAANWGAPKFVWPDDTGSASFVVHFPANEAGMNE
ncbi:MAG TPA: hypothetical protein VJU82_14680 [Acidobacteriaceae bacterium]|nr:hypothetical protein [Acidobacteriaceae bacterium]